MQINYQKNLKFKNRYNFLKNIFCKFFLFFLLFNINHSKIKRDDVDPRIVSVNILKLIHTEFVGNNTKKNTFSLNLDDYTIVMKFLNIKIIPEEIKIEDHNYRNWVFFTYMNPNIEFILSLEISNNNNYTNAKNDSLSILYNTNSQEPNFKFELKNIFASIDCNYIQFEQQSDNTYKFSLFKTFDEFKRIKIFIDLKNLKNFGKINKFFEDKKDKIEIFLFNSFNNYLSNIVSRYPPADGVFLYNEVVRRILHVNTFVLEYNEDKTIEKISINNIKEEKYISDFPSILFINVEIKFELIYTENIGHKSFSEIIPEIDFHSNAFYTNETNFKIGNTTLSNLIDGLFLKIVNEYIKG